MHKEMDKLVRQCVWGSLKIKRKIHFLGWDVLCRSKLRGGAIFRRSEDVNRCLLAKFGWHILTGEGEGWCTIIRSKYNLTENGSWLFKSKQ